MHHFPTLGALIGELVGHLVARNEAAVREAAAGLDHGADPVLRALTALYESMARPAAQAEFELWAAARTDPALAEALRTAERNAGRDLRRVVDALFGPDVVAHPRYPDVRDLTIAILRGTAISRPLRSSERAATATIDRWAEAMTVLLAQNS